MSLGSAGGKKDVSVEEAIEDVKQKCVKAEVKSQFSSELTITEDMDCIAAYPVIDDVLNLCYLKYGERIVSPERMLKIEDHFKSKEVIVSFYGTSNGGKSTILNTILGAKYLPMNGQNETAVSVKIMFKCSEDELEPDSSTKKCQFDNGENEELTPDEVCKRLKIMNKESRNVRNSKENSNCECVLLIKHPVKCITKETDGVVLLDTPGLDEFGSEKVSQCVAMAENMSSAFIFVTTFMDYKRDKLSSMLQELYKKDKGILKDDRLTIVINKIDEALMIKEDEQQYTKDSVISEVRNFFCTVVFECKPEEMSTKCVIVLCSSWSLCSRTCEMLTTRHVRNLCDTNLLPHDDFKKSLQEEPIAKKQKKILEQYSNILELESRLLELCKQSFKFWGKKLVIDQLSLLTDVLKKLKDLMLMKEKEYEDLHTTITNYSRASENYKAFCTELINHQKMIKKEKCLPDAAIVKIFRDAFEEDIKKENLEKLMKNDIFQALSAFSNLMVRKRASGNYSPSMFEKELQETSETLFESLKNRMNSLKCLSEVFLKESISINMEIERLSNDCLKTCFKDMNFTTEPVVCNQYVQIPPLTTKVNIPLKLKWWQKIDKLYSKWRSEGFFMQIKQKWKDISEVNIAEHTLNVPPKEVEVDSSAALYKILTLHLNTAEEGQTDTYSKELEDEEKTQEGNEKKCDTYTSNSLSTSCDEASAMDDDKMEGQTDIYSSELEDEDKTPERNEKKCDTDTSNSSANSDEASAMDDDKVSSASSDEASAMDDDKLGLLRRTPERNKKECDTNTSNSSASSDKASAMDDDKLSHTDLKLSRNAYRRWCTRMDLITEAINEDFAKEIEDYIKERNDIISQCCCKYYNTAVQIIMEFEKKNGHVIEEYKQNFSEVREKARTLEEENKDIKSFIKKIENMTRVLEEISKETFQ